MHCVPDYIHDEASCRLLIELGDTVLGVEVFSQRINPLLLQEIFQTQWLPFSNNNNKKKRKEKPTGRWHARNTYVTQTDSSKIFKHGYVTQTDSSRIFKHGPGRLLLSIKRRSIWNLSFYLSSNSLASFLSQTSNLVHSSLHLVTQVYQLRGPELLRSKNQVFTSKWSECMMFYTHDVAARFVITARFVTKVTKRAATPAHFVTNEVVTNRAGIATFSSHFDISTCDIVCVTCVCVCVCVCARARARVRACVRACVRVWERGTHTHTQNECVRQNEREKGEGERDTQETTKDRRRDRQTDRQTEMEREGDTEKVTEREKQRQTQRNRDRHTERHRESDSERERERVREGERARINMLGTYYATKCTRRCMEWNITPKVSPRLPFISSNHTSYSIK